MEFPRKAGAELPEEWRFQTDLPQPRVRLPQLCRPMHFVRVWTPRRGVFPVSLVPRNAGLSYPIPLGFAERCTDFGVRGPVRAFPLGDMSPRTKAASCRRGPRYGSAGNTFGQVFEFGNVKDGTAGEIFGETVGVQIKADFDSIFADEGHVMIGEVVVRAVRHADAERPEGLGLQQFAELSRRDHGGNVKKDCPRCNHLFD